MADTILTIHRVITSRQSQVIGELPAQSIQSWLHIAESSFGKALDIDNENLVQIEKLSRQTNAAVELNYLKLAVAYIIANPDRVNAWIDLDRVGSALSFAGDAEGLKARLLALRPVDQQALSSMKLYAALHSFSDQMIREYLDTNLPSHWTQNRLLYPFVYYFINLPEPHALDQLLGQILPRKGTGPAEKILAKFLLTPDQPETANLAMRCYVALLSHPYDALEYLTTDLARRFAYGDRIEPTYLEQFELLARAFPQHRVSRLVSLARGEQLPYVECPAEFHGIALDSSGSELGMLRSIFDMDCQAPPEISQEKDVLLALRDARWSRYPDPKHFDELASFHRKFAVLASARLVRHVATSLYLFSRTEPKQERLDLLSGILITGNLNPFAFSGPQGYAVAKLGRFNSDLSATELIDKVASHLGPLTEKREDRIWIKAANWSLLQSQAEGRIHEWANLARARFPVLITPRYLSGLDWNWLSGFISAVGMGPLVGNLDVIFCLFLRQLEEFRRESVPLRVSIEPITRKIRSVEEFSEWLHNNLGADSSAFIRYFLTPDTILKLRLTDNYVAAVSYRLELLTRAVKKYDFKEGVFDQGDLEREQARLTAMLCRMSVGARQFEVGWDTLFESALERTRDAYSAYEAVSLAVPEDAVANTRRTSPYQFANAATGDYEAPNRDWPLVLVIGGVIDTFLTHPTTGIESILSVRIRHDAFRREYENAIKQVEIGDVAGVSPARSRKIVASYPPPVYREIQRWLDARMHTHRKDKSQGLFDYIPTKAEMSALLEIAQGSDLEGIVRHVFDWIKPRLEKDLERAREFLAAELGPALERRVQTTRLEQAQHGGTSEEHQRVADAVAAAFMRRTKELDEWFRIPEGNRDQSLSIDEVFNAVRQRFRLDEAAGNLRLKGLPGPVSSHEISPANIRHVYDLLSEIVQNVRKYAAQPGAALHISRSSGSSGSFLVFSNRRAEGEAGVDVIVGHPYATLQEALFGEGNSGLKKVAYLAASLVRANTSVHVCRKGMYFHVAVPLAAFGSEPKAMPT
ncbi:hypothetical protein HMF7854_11240 [Sphingomonas ginkgonis]|uniref:Uncharacterized protein n=1 Tax=Sphingomonas ginkgonis TaxID=2315330 RepID=A0A3R9WPK1_9SPHN|nr:hypothetical protein [Sphingomonas ginkgonis]RST31350.1 hypothetical protein HMF7854_11240 [Sphingomonas ginkgonis]